jgi:DNA-binding CsgD family transcriptional regulator
MRELRTQELRKLLDAILILNQDLEPETLPARAMTAAHKVVSNEVVCFGDIDLPKAKILHATAPHDPRWLPGHPDWEALVNHVTDDPVMSHFGRTGDVTPRKYSDFLSERQFRSTGLYSEFFRKFGLGAQMAVPFNDPDKGRQRLVGVSVNRKVSSDFNERDRACLAVLRAHAAQAVRNADKFAQLRKQLDQALNGNGAHGPDGSDPVAIAEPTKGSPRRTSVKPRVSLTKRETEVLYWAGMGKTNDEIGQIIGAAAGTVKKHLEHVYEKLAVRNRTAAAQYVRGVLNLPER